MATTLDNMLALLVRLSLHYPQAGRTPAELRILAADWCEDLSSYSHEIVTLAAKKIRRESEFFPTTASMFAVCEGIKRGKEAQLELPEYPSEEDYERNRRMARGLVDRIRGNSCANGPVRAAFGSVLNGVRQ